MQTILWMCLGVAVGKWLFPRKWAGKNSKLQTALTLLMIFTMGLSLGSDEDLLHSLTTMGGDSILFCLLPMAASVLVVYLVTHLWFDRKRGGQ